MVEDRSWFAVSCFGSAAVAILISLKLLRSENTRSSSQSGQWRCYCGQVQAAVSIHTKNIPSAECHCDDCCGFGRWMHESLDSPVNVMSNNGGVYMAQLYKDEFQITAGAHLIKRVKLSEKSFLLRLFTTCCKTPLGLIPDWKLYPMIVCYREGFTGIEFGTVWWRLYTERMHTTERKERGKGRAIETAQLSTSFLVFTLGRVLYGVVFGRNKPDPLENLVEAVEIINIKS